MAHDVRPRGTGFVGNLPDGWLIRPMSEVCIKVTDGTHDTPRTTEVGRPFVTAIHIKGGKIDFDNCLHLSEADHREIYKRCDPISGDLAVVNIGAGVGECGLVDVDFEFSMKNVALLKPDRSKLDSKFLFNIHQFRKNRIAHAIKSGGAQPFLSLRDLRKLPLLVPPLSEQRKIAEILSTWDRAIETTEALLANARTQKRALMQSLLTGNRRFPEFEGQEWNTSKLVDHFDFINGRAFKPEDWGDSGLPIIRIQNLTGSTDAINRFDGSVDEKHLVRDGEFLLSWSATLDTFIWRGEDAVLNQHIFKVLPRGDTLKMFGFHLITYEIGKLVAKVHGTSMKHITKKDLAKIEAFFPEIAEQERITEVLDDAQRENDRLVSDIEKLRTEKKALMQQLLTGKRRVTVD